MLISIHEIMEVLFELSEGLIMVHVDGCQFDGLVHSFDLSVGPGMFEWR